MIHFLNNHTKQIPKNLLPLKLIYHHTTQTYTPYILQTQPYLPLNHPPPHPYPPKITPKLTSLYKPAPTIYPHLIHTHLLINFLTKSQPIPQRLLIPTIQPQQRLSPIFPNTPNKRYHLTNPPPKWTNPF
ncbi:DNA-3-methyladenine glycosylase, partial [Staphylococcus aureus]|uniref:DNA-3-methyladenine glycosylase n=1 Tax=Staphylococcus aureus TaxID=1280 RepID=UPI0037D9E706